MTTMTTSTDDYYWDYEMSTDPCPQNTFLTFFQNFMYTGCPIEGLRDIKCDLAHVFKVI